MNLNEWDKALNKLDEMHGGKILLNVCAQWIWRIWDSLFRL